MTRLRAWVVFLVVLAFAAAGTPSSLRSAPAAPELQVSAPSRVEVGQPITLTLTVRNATDLAGYELAVLFDSSAAEFDSLRQRQNDLKRLGRDVSPLTAIDLPHGVAIGLYSCPVANCVDSKGARQGSARGTIKLATLALIAKQAGPLEIRLDAPKFVAADGTAVTIAVPSTPIVVQVGSGGTRHAAPGSMWTLKGASAGAPGPFELTGDGRVTHADAMEVALAWTRSREQSTPCGQLADLSRDVNHDGCIDVADLQLVANNSTTLSSATSGSTSSAAAQVASSAATSLIFTVNSTADTPDANVGNGVCATSANVCTLRAAIAEANAHAGADTIAFNIAGTGTQTIQLASALPTLNDASGPTSIDGYTQPGASPNSDPLVSNAVIKIQVRGNGSSAFDGLTITSAGNLIRGLAFFNLKRSIVSMGSGATDNTIVGNFIGTDATGTFAFTTEVAGSVGIHLGQGTVRTHVGGTAPADRNVISGNAQHGLATYYEQTNNNVIINNIIGLSPRGDRRLSNMKHGVDINYDSAYNVIGGTAAGERNVIAGNLQSGVEFSHGTDLVQNKAIGNYIGTDASGTAAGNTYAYNSGYGVQMEDGATDNLAADNVIGNSRLGGVHLENYNVIGNQITNNRIGIGVDGSSIPNNSFGVQVAYRVSRIMIGPGNIIANNPEGIQIVNPENDFNTITRNSIYNNNGRGIDLQPLDPVNPNPNDVGDTDSGANEQLNWPVLTSATPYQVTGTACAEANVPKPCTVEVFVADRGAGGYGQGKTFLGAATTANNGSFTVVLNGAVSVGDYVTATATDATGNTSEFGANHQVVAGSPVSTPTPTSTPGGVTTYAADTFSRNVTDGWGLAEVGGGYGLEAPARPASDYDVNGNAGTMTIPDTNIHSAYLATVSAQDVDATVRVKTDKVATGGFQFAYLVARRVSPATEYLGRLGFDPSGTVLLQAAKSKFVNNVETITLLGTQASAGGLHQTANSYIWLHAQVVGTNPTTIRLKAWADGQAEPAAWQYSVSDSEPGLQAPGAVGLRAAVSPSSTNFPVLFSFDDFRVTSIDTSPPPPTSTPTDTPGPPTNTPTDTPTSTPTDTPGPPTDTPTSTPTDTPTPLTTTYASDTFSRILTDNWGSAELGGAYTLAGTAADFDVTGTSGTISNAMNATRSAYLASVSAQDVDIMFRVQTDKVPLGGGQMVYGVVRRVGSNGTDYLVRLRFTPDNKVGIQAAREVAGTATLLGTEKMLPGLAPTANTFFWVRAQVVGLNPTTLRMKAWVDGQSEPTTWQYSITDSTVSLQVAGGVGLRTYLAAGATNAPILFTFDDFQVTSVSAP